VFWKSKKRHIKKSTFESVYEKKHKDMPHRIPIRKRFRKKKSTILEDKDYNEQQDEDGTITFPCSVCNQEIAISNNFLHKKQHEALATLGFQWMGRKKPHPVMIAVQRQFIISKMLSSFMFTEAILQNINNSFELLSKKQIPGYHYKIFDSLGKSSIHSQKICHVLIKGVATCGDRNSTWRAEMNDKFTIMNYFGNKPNVCFFGLFDGHHGASAAELASKELPVLLLHQLSKCDPSFEMTPEQQQIINSFRTVFREEYIAIEDLFSSAHKVRKTQKRGHEDMHKAFAKAFWRMDRLLRLGRKEVSRVRWSGCSAVTCILEGSFKNPFVNDNWRGTNFDTRSFSSQMTPQIISGVLHIANAGMYSE
jgi:serine/threonine protein phosphatase PrpC